MRRQGGEILKLNSDPPALEATLWRALSEAMVLLCLRRNDASAPTVSQWVGGRCVLPAFNPYKTIVDLEEKGCVRNVGARVDLDGRRRQFYQITQEGQDALEGMLDTVERVAQSVRRMASDTEEAER